MLRGRDAALEAIGGLAAGAREGRSGVLVVRGGAGIGKTALLDRAVADAADVLDVLDVLDGGRGSGGLRVLRAAGVEAEARLPFAALQMLLRPVSPRLEELPPVQAAALRGALGLSDTAGQDPFLVGLAVLTLLSDLAAERPLLCVVDDAHWLDPASAGALLFAARRLGAEGVAMVFAARDEARTEPPDGERDGIGAAGFEAAGLPELMLAGLDREAAAGLLAERVPDLAAPVRDRVLDEAGGNPLALIELPAALSAEQRAGRAAPPAPLPASGRVLEAFADRVGRLPERARLALAVAAAEGTGDLGTVLRAGRALEVSADDLDAAARAGLLRVTGTSVEFGHPLIRAAAYQRAATAARTAVHGALAGVLDGDRRALHLAAASPVPDEDVAAEVERAADGARARGALAAAPALYEEAARLSPGRDGRARRLTRAAQSAITVGRTVRAAALAERAETLTGDPLLRAGLAMVRATAEFERGTPRGTAGLLADRAGPVLDADPGLALTLLVMAAGNAWAAGEDASIRRVARAAAGLVSGPSRGPVAVPCSRAALAERAELERVAAALAALGRVVDGDAAGGMPVLRALVEAARVEPSGSLIVRLFVIEMALLLGDDRAVAELAAADVAHARRRGLAGALPAALQPLAQAQAMDGLHRDAAATVAEAMVFARDTGQRHRRWRLAAVTARLAAVEGEARECARAAAVPSGEPGADGGPAAGGGPGAGGAVGEAQAAAGCALALLDLGTGRYEEALRRLEEAAHGPARHTAAVVCSAADLVEAAVRAGAPERAAGHHERFAAWAAAVDVPWAAAVALRCRALLAAEGGAGDRADALYAEAVRLHREGGRPFERARTELLFGERLRRERRRSDARVPLRSALGIFERLGAAPWAARAAAELRATGGAAAPGETGDGAEPANGGAGAEALGQAGAGGGADPLGRLTPQELQIVRLAASGAGNRDIAAQLFLSHRTVEYHLYKAFPKLGVVSRTELARFARPGP